MSAPPSHHHRQGVTSCVGEWRVPVSPKLDVRDLTLLASSCRAVGSGVVVFSYVGAAGKPLPETPTRDELATVARDAGLRSVLTRLDLDDVSDVGALPKTLATAAQRFDVFAVLLENDPLLFEREKEVGRIFDATRSIGSTAGAVRATQRLPVIINIDGCKPGALIFPRKNMPAGACIEVSYASLVTDRNMVPHQLLDHLRGAMPHVARFPVLVSCGGPVVGARDLDAAVMRVKSPVDAACLAEVVCGRRDLLLANRRLCRRVLIAKAAASLRAAASRRAASATAAAAGAVKTKAAVAAAPTTTPRDPATSAVTVVEAPPSLQRLDSALLEQILRARFTRPPSSRKSLAMMSDAVPATAAPATAAPATAAPAPATKAVAATGAHARRRAAKRRQRDDTKDGPAAPPSSASATAVAKPRDGAVAAAQAATHMGWDEDV